MSLRSPLGAVLGSGSAKDGTEHWWLQRVTAIALLLLGGWFAFSLTQMDSFAHENVISWMARPFNSVMMMLLGVTLTWHSALGIQVVIEDYVHGPMIKIASLLIAKFAHVFLAIAAVFAVLKIALGGSA